MRTLAFVAVALPVAVLGVVGSLHAQTVRVLPIPPPPTTSMPSITKLPRGVAPGALAPALRVSRIQSALKAANLTGTAPQTLEMRVTPLAPKSSNGAELVGAGAVHFSGPEPGTPDGEYAFGASGLLALPYVHMRFVTEPNKLYVIDCRLKPAPGAQKMSVVIGKSSGPGTTLPLDGGHVLHAIQATASSTEIHLFVVPAPNATHHGYFYGCDFGKVQ